MEGLLMSKQVRHPMATISMFGITHFHRQNPYLVAWWSAAYPGFGHYLLNQYVRATILTLIEVTINTLAHINESIVYTFCGNFEKAASVLRPEWVFGYLMIYFFAIGDSFRSTLMQNKLCHLAELENNPICSVHLHPLEIQYLEQKNPFLALWYSIMFPGLGQLYNHQFVLAFYAIFWWWFYLIMSHVYESAFYMITGNLQQAISVLNIHWLLFLPSIVGGATYHAFIIVIEHNRLYRMEQRRYLAERYGNNESQLFPSGGLINC
jgi:hypothetical protein